MLYGDHPDPTYLGLEEAGMMLFYDITFCLGRVYATLLTYINCCYEGNPVMPLAVNLHERKFKSSHQLFWARIVGDIPALQKYRLGLIFIIFLVTSSFLSMMHELHIWMDLYM